MSVDHSPNGLGPSPVPDFVFSQALMAGVGAVISVVVSTAPHVGTVGAIVLGTATGLAAGALAAWFKWLSRPPSPPR